MRKINFLAVTAMFLGSVLTSTATAASSATVPARVPADAEGLIFEMNHTDVGLMKMGTSSATVACGNGSEPASSRDSFVDEGTAFIHRPAVGYDKEVALVRTIYLAESTIDMCCGAMVSKEDSRGPGLMIDVLGSSGVLVVEQFGFGATA